MNTVFYIRLDPVAFRLGSLSVSWYELMIALAVVTVLAWLVWQNRRARLMSSWDILVGALIAIPAGIVFSKLLHVADQPDLYIGHWGAIISAEGLTIWGAVLGATLAVWIYSLIRRNFQFAPVMDLMVPGIILAQAVGRVGCTINGCCYGIPSDSPLAVIYTRTPYAPLGTPVLPVTVFEIIFNLLVFAALLLLRGRLKKPGTLALIYFALYAAWRFGSDFLRGGTGFFQNIHFLTGVPFLSALHQAQVVALIILLITVPLIVLRHRRLRRVEEKAVP
jgi:phosphatidylglycerol---prolipoprotein diacylglyceryl transferase